MLPSGVVGVALKIFLAREVLGVGLPVRVGIGPLSQSVVVIPVLREYLTDDRVRRRPAPADRIGGVAGHSQHMRWLGLLVSDRHPQPPASTYPEQPTRN